MKFASSFVAFVLAGAALASPMKRSGALNIDLAAPSNDLKITATVTNSGSEDIKVLKYGTVLDSLPTKSFVVTKDDVEVPFTGIKLSVSLKDADDSAYTVIPAGQSVTVTHDVKSIFDFASAGAGNFKFAPVTDFLVAGSEEATLVQPEALDVNANAVEVSLDKVEKQEPLEKRGRTTCSNTSQASFISSAYTEAKQMATAAANYVSSSGASSLVTAYFKTSSTSTVRSILTSVANENSSTRTLSCTDALGACTSGVIAYTVISTTNVYFCSIFFQEVAQSNLCTGRTTVAARNIRGATVLHELTHATGGTTDVQYGCAADQALSASNQIRNADNYNCFASQVWLDNQC